MIEHLPGIYKVVGSIPSASNKSKHSLSLWRLRRKDWYSHWLQQVSVPCPMVSVSAMT